MRHIVWLVSGALACAGAPAGSTETGAPETRPDPSSGTSLFPTGEPPVDLGTGEGDPTGMDTSTGTSSDPCPTTGCPPCTPGEHRCTGAVLQACTDTGWVDVQTCDALMGAACDPRGACVGACQDLGASNIGCDYYPVTTAQIGEAFVDSTFAVAVVNAGDQAASITMTYDGDVIAAEIVIAGGVAVIPLPRITALTSAQHTTLVRGGAYRLRSTRPVTVYQYNTLKKATSNDASVLLPVNTWSGRHVVASWHHWEAFNIPGMIAVTASQDGTHVTLIPPHDGTATDTGPGVSADGHAAVVLDAGDVLQVFTRKTGDFTGMQVLADRPVQVLGGHACTAVPSDSFACDHLEEMMLPFEALGRAYAVVPPVQWPDTTQPKAIYARVVAAEDAATLTFSPPQDAASYLATAGDFVEIGPTTDAFVVSSDKKLVVAQYMVSEEFGHGTSDPSMVLAIPRDQHRASYRLYGHPSWTATFIDVVAPAAAAVQIDGAPVLGWIPIGATGLGYAHVNVSNAGSGVHEVLATSPVGVSVHGLGDYGSYWYPGGLNVGVIPQ